MDSASIDSASYRHGDHGPAYLIQGPTADIGVLRLRPGDDMPNHYHERCDESFIVLEGTVNLWVDCTHAFTLRAGDVYRCAPGEMHYFRNDSSAPMRLIFIKSPQSAGDTITVDWQVGQPPLPRPDLTH